MAPAADPYARGAASFYIPKTATGRNRYPRHCAARRLRSRAGYHLDMAARGAKPALRAGLPTSLNITWSIMGPDATESC